MKINQAVRVLFRTPSKKDLSGHNKQENKIGDAISLNPGTGHKSQKCSDIFQEGGTMVFDTETK